ncbi:MAG: OmpA family protein [Deltaproteobacteria bacterium]|nr:OmpA family protein [Deltaproteobacteria bacterium]
MADDPDASGISVYPRLPVPKPRQPSDPKLPKKKGGAVEGKYIGAAVVMGLIGATVGYVAHRPDGSGADKAKADVVAAQKAASVEKDRADGLAKQLDDEKAARDAAEKTAAAATTKAADSESAAAKLQATIDKSQGSVSTEGDEIHLKLVDKVLFAVGDDKLTDKGKAVLDKIAVALKALPDKQVWVQGHTDDQPIYIPPAPKKAEPAPKKLPKGAKAPPPPAAPEPAVRFATNWELSAARALTVVHYLQDSAKIDPSRLAALAFGQYRPVSRSNKALNRRIEIVLVPKKAVVEKEVLPAAGSGAGSAAAAPKKK